MNAPLPRRCSIQKNSAKPTLILFAEGPVECGADLRITAADGSVLEEWKMTVSDGEARHAVETDVANLAGASMHWEILLCRTEPVDTPAEIAFAIQQDGHAPAIEPTAAWRVQDIDLCGLGVATAVTGGLGFDLIG